MDLLNEKVWTAIGLILTFIGWTGAAYNLSGSLDLTVALLTFALVSSPLAAVYVLRNGYLKTGIAAIISFLLAPGIALLAISVFAQGSIGMLMAMIILVYLSLIVPYFVLAAGIIFNLFQESKPSGSEEIIDKKIIVIAVAILVLVVASLLGVYNIAGSFVASP